VHQAAIYVGADYLITRNKQDFAHSAIPVRTPSEFFEDYEKQTGISYAELYLPN